MLTTIERKNVERQIAHYRAGETVSRAAGNVRNADLLAQRRQTLEQRLQTDDRAKLTMHRRSAVVQDQLADKARRLGNIEAAARCEKARDQAFAAAGEIAARIEPARSTPAPSRSAGTSAPVTTTTPAAVSSSRPLATTAHDEPGGSFVDLRTGQRVVCKTMGELRARVFAMVDQLGVTPAPASGGFHGFAVPAVF